MADTKISALTSATTPLAGTEVLPIVQSSTTVKVATNDLTVRNVRANATTGILQITGPAAASTRVATVPDANWTAARTDAGQTFTGDQNISTGNLKITTGGKIVTLGTSTQATNGLFSAAMTIADSNATAGIVSAAGTTASLAQNGTADVYSFPSGYPGVALIIVTGADPSTVWRAAAIVWCSSVANTVYTITNSNVTVTGNGTAIRLTNTSASSQALAWSVLRLS
jgi:hypothetical protein